MGIGVGIGRGVGRALRRNPVGVGVPERVETGVVEGEMSSVPLVIMVGVIVDTTRGHVQDSDE
jgi:hypothetical protein